jgi:hypothetical protein
MGVEEWKELAQDRVKWRDLVLATVPYLDILQPSAKKKKNI